MRRACVLALSLPLLAAGAEDGDDPKVKAWSEAENAHARAFLDAMPGPRR